MGFGGSAAAMITSLKNNKRKRVSAFEKIKNHKKGSSKQTITNKKATSHQLESIRKKLQSENKIKFRRTIFLFTIAIVILVYVIGFVKF